MTITYHAGRRIQGLSYSSTQQDLTTGTTDAGTNSTIRGFGNQIKSAHAIVGSTLTKVEVSFKTSMTGTATVGVWDSSNNLKLTLGTKDLSTLTGSEAYYTFDTGSVTMEANWIIGFQISGTATNTSVTLRTNGTNADPNIDAYNYNSSSGWSLDGTTREYNMKIHYNNGGDEKPTNVQLGSRLEETDTRKIYYYNSASFASGTPNLATSTITLGDGGTYGGTAASKQGNDSTAFTLTAKGGGAGSGYQPTSLSEGGSGGGDSASENPPPENHWAGIQPTQSGDSGTYGYGKAGGTSAYNSNTYINSGGAGGSFEIGQDTVNSADSARGGDGLGGTNNTIINQFLIDSSAGVQDGSTGYYYIAGGGGGGNVRAAGTAGAGGKGGGGNGCIDSGSSAGDGVANTGSGGGGGGNNVTHEGNGGKGVCIVKYRTSEITATGGNNTYVVGDYTYRKFTSSGTLTVNSGTGKYDVLLIAGGGAGNDGAGGAGGVVFRNGLQINSWEELGT